MPNYRNHVQSYRNETNCACESRRYLIDDMPLAMAYVPWQRWQNIMEAEKGFSCGTIFADLNKPFCRAGGGCR